MVFKTVRIVSDNEFYLKCHQHSVLHFGKPARANFAGFEKFLVPMARILK
jgi:hypothetical protein